MPRRDPDESWEREEMSSVVIMEQTNVLSAVLGQLENKTVKNLGMDLKNLGPSPRGLLLNDQIWYLLTGPCDCFLH